MAVVLVTGSSSGMGLETAAELARRGHEVFASMRDPSRADALLAEAGEARSHVRIVTLDVRSPESVRECVEEVLREADRIDVLVNNAGILAVGPIEHTSEAELEAIVDTNVLGAIRTTQAVLPAMREQRSGRIVNISSPAAHPRFGARMLGVYGASKAALSAFTLELNKEVRPLGICAVLIEAGLEVDSRMWRGGMERLHGPAIDDAGYAPGVEFLREAVRNEGNRPHPREAGIMIADACTVPDPPLRFPPDDYRYLDAVDRIRDSAFLESSAQPFEEAQRTINAEIESRLVLDLMTAPLSPLVPALRVMRAGARRVLRRA